MVKKLYHGAAWYPELWEEAVLEEDIRLMKECGINVVRIGEFAWSRMEPSEGEIQLDFFVNVIERLYKNGIDTVMCTPTPTPPIWFTHGHPERMYVDDQGRVMGHGSRQHPCTNHPYFRKKAAELAEALGRELGSHPGLVGWQLDNEFKAHVSECMCETCRGLWHSWLEERYGTVDVLNEAWGADIWSERYQRFDQVPQPAAVPFLHNSSLRTMYQLFSMEKIAEFAHEQAEILRRYSRAPITHNSSIAFHVDNERLFQGLDFASYDTYASLENVSAYLINCDLWRNFKSGRDFWIMETSPSYGGSLEGYGNPHPNGYLKAEAVAAYALGAEAFCYWLWRQHRAGCEQPHGSIISAWGRPTVGYTNVLEVETARRELEAVILGSRPLQAQVAITYSDVSKAFLRTEPHRKLNHRSLMTSFYEHILHMGVHRDLVPEGGSLEGYKVLLTPFLPYMSEGFRKRALAFVRAGGTWVVGPLTGGRTGEHTLHTDAALGRVLEEEAGVETVFSYPMEGTGGIGRAFGVEAPLSLWSSLFAVRDLGAAVLGVLEDGLSPGLAYLTERQLGRGRLLLLGSMPAGEAGHEQLVRLLEYVFSSAGALCRMDVSPGTIVAPRRTPDGGEVWVAVNMDGKGGRLSLPRAGVDAVSGSPVPAGELVVGRFEHRAIRLG